MFLSVDDRDTYFPSVPLTEVTDGLLISAQNLVESCHGANRKLEISSYVQIFDHPTNASLSLYQGLTSFQLQHWPIVPGTVSVGSRSQVSLSGYTPLPATAWRLDIDSNRIEIGRFYPGEQVRVAYDAGFDPEIATDIKFDLGQIVAFLHSQAGKNIQSGVSEFSESGVFSVKFGGNANDYFVAGVPAHLLLPFVKLQPKVTFL